MAPMSLQAARLDLMPMRASHVELLARSERDYRWAPDYPQPTDLDAARQLFESGLLHHDDGGRFGVWLVVEHATGLVIGTIGFDGPPHEGVLQVSYSIVPSRQGKGVAAEALDCLTRFATGQPEVRAIEAYAQSPASAAVLQKTGYALEAIVAETGKPARYAWNRTRDSVPAGVVPSPIRRAAVK